MKNTLKLLTVLLLALALTACAGREVVPLPVADDYDVVTEATPSGTLRVGLVPGLYSDMFTEVIQPFLEKMGYTIEIILYNDDTSPNAALANSEIDLNMYQNYKALNNYKLENDVALSAIAEVPTAHMSIFSPVYTSLQEVENRAKVSLPLEKIEVSRALTALENAGLLSLDPSIDRSNAGWPDIVDNPYNLNFNPFQLKKLLNAFTSSKLLVVDSGYVLNSGLELPKPIYEEIGEAYLTVIAVRTGNLHAQFVSDIIDIVYSDEYKTLIAAPGGKYENYQRPRSFFG